MQNIFDRLELADKEPLTVGRKRLIFRHPHNNDWLVKLYRTSIRPKRFSRIKAAFFSHYQQYSTLIGLKRELSQYILSRYYDNCPLIDHLYKIIGFVDTDMGLGLIVEALKDKSGNLAPTVRKLINCNQLGQERQEKLQIFFEKIIASDLVIGDINLGNIVLAHLPDGEERFFLVDGLGDKVAIPIHSWCNRLHKRYKRKKVNRLQKTILSKI